MKSKLYMLILTVFLLTACQSAPTREEKAFDAAQAAYQAGNYRESAALMEPLAQKGDAQAQYILGYQYYYGLGVTRDKQQGYFWIQQSAQQGYLPAREALNRLIKQRG